MAINRLLKMVEVFQKSATFYNQKLDATPASIIISNFDAICQKQYKSLEEAKSDIIDALSSAGAIADFLPIENDQGGFKTEIGFATNSDMRPIKNIKIGIAWKNMGKHYRLAAHLLDENGKRIMNSNTFKEPERKPKFWPQDNSGFTKDPERFQG